MLIVLTLLGRLLFAAVTGLGTDESYMVAAGRRVQLGYFDHPPVSWWLAWGAARVFGGPNSFIVRLPFILLFAATTALMYRVTASMYGARAGFWAAATLNVIPVFGVTTASWVLPDGPLLAALVGALVCLKQALPARGRAAWGWWLGSGFCAGLALCSKYTGILSLLGAAVYLASEPRQGRPWLSLPHPYAAGLLSLALFAPVLVWNAQHAWVSLVFQSGRASGRFQPFGPFVTLGGEALFLLPWVWAALMICAARALQVGRDDRDSWLLLCLATPPILLFLIKACWGRVLFHWASPGYVMLVPLLGKAIANRWRSQPMLRRSAAATAAFVVAGVVLIGAEVRFGGVRTALFARRPDPSLALDDWRSLKADLAGRGMLTRPQLVVAGVMWHEVGKIDYALGGALPVTSITDDPREYGLIAPLSRFFGYDALIVAPRDTLQGVTRKYGWHFESIQAIAPSRVVHNGAVALVLPMFIGRRLRR